MSYILCVFCSRFAVKGLVISARWEEFMISFHFLYHFVRQVIRFFFLWAVSFSGSRILLPELMG